MINLFRNIKVILAKNREKRIQSKIKKGRFKLARELVLKLINRNIISSKEDISIMAWLGIMHCNDDAKVNRLRNEIDNQTYNFEFDSGGFDATADYVAVFYLKLFNKEEYIFTYIQKYDFRFLPMIANVYRINNLQEFSKKKYKDYGIIFQFH